MKYLLRALLFAFFLLNVLACDEKPKKPAPEIVEQTFPIPQQKINVVSGSLVYVPAYARIFHYNDELTLSLVTTLAIHNTDPDHPLILRTIRYYSENGTLLKAIIKEPRILAPLATAIYHLVPEKPGAGIGANAMVEWVSEYKIVKPIIEAIMVSRDGNMGVSFISPGYVVRDIGK